MSAAESNSTDVQQRILLEVAYEAVENGKPRAPSCPYLYTGSDMRLFQLVFRKRSWRAPTPLSTLARLSKAGKLIPCR